MERNNRTWLCSILFLDIVGYSKLFVDMQLGIKRHFTDMISESLKDLSEKDLIILDTGDGMAVSYLGDPEDMLFTAIGLRDAFDELASTSAYDYKVRLGINLGPVKIMEDINGNRNIVGDGINVAQRIMDFAGPNQLYVSRSFFDVVSCLDNSYQDIFKYLGQRADKHVRKHAVYQVLNKDSDSIETDYINEPSTVLSETTENISANSIKDQIDGETLSKISNTLADYIGPMASIIVKRQAKKNNNINDLVQSVADEIPHDDDRQLFIRQCSE